MSIVTSNKACAGARAFSALAKGINNAGSSCVDDGKANEQAQVGPLFYGLPCSRELERSFAMKGYAKKPDAKRPRGPCSLRRPSSSSYTVLLRSCVLHTTPTQSTDRLRRNNAVQFPSWMLTTGRSCGKSQINPGQCFSQVLTATPRGPNERKHRW